MTDVSRLTRSVSPGRMNDFKLSESLLFAASRGQLDLVRDLLARGAAFHEDKDGCTALHYAAEGNHAHCCKMLVSAGCDTNQQDKIGFTPLMKAASHGAYEAAHILLEAGCQVNIQDEHGNTALHEACWNGFSKTAELLVQYNCDVCISNRAGFTALHLASQNGHNESSRVLLYAGCNPDLKNNYGDTALHTASRYGHAGVARILISARCKLSEQNKNGDTALHIAAALKRRKIAKILVESGIDVKIVNKQNETALDVAKRKDHPEIMQLITSIATPSRYLPTDPISLHKDQPVNGPSNTTDVEHSKPEPKPEKESRRFFIFKKKKKDKDKVVVSPTSQKKTVPDTSVKPTKPAVHGFFSHYVPREGVQLYRDLAGNIKQGPIGYAPVCQCGPSLKRLENTITDTKESLYNYMDASHQILSQRIEHLDKQTGQQALATKAMLKDHFVSEEYACHDRISSRLAEERQDTQAYVSQANTDMRDQLEYWLNDKLASYGHCLDHHHDDSALPPRNLFTDFVSRSNLVRSRSDETLSASDYSGKFRKKDFYASRQAAMQQIRGWDVPNVESKEKSSRRERNNNNAVMTNKMTVQAEVHTINSDRRLPVTANIPAHNSGMQSTAHHHEVNIHSQALNQKSQSGDLRSRSIERSSFQHRVTFSSEAQVQYTPRIQHRPYPALNYKDSQSPVAGIHNSLDTSHIREPRQHSANKAHPNFIEGCPPNTVVKSSDQGGTHTPQLTGQGSTSLVYTHNRSENQILRDWQPNNGYMGQSRTFSVDSNLNSNTTAAPYMRQHISRSHSAENTLDTIKPNDVHPSGYMTDSGLKTAHNIRYSQRSCHSSSPAPTRYHTPDVQAASSQKSYSSSSSMRHTSSDHDKRLNSSSDSSNKHITGFKSPDSSQYSRVNRPESRLQHFMPPMKECLQHDMLSSPTSAPPMLSKLNKEDSTCSSNQDSGYGSRNPYGIMGTVNGGGTPSSSFCLERSSSDIPSNTGSPVTFSDSASHSFPSDHLTKSPPFSSEQYSNTSYYNRPITDHWKPNAPRYGINSSNNDIQASNSDLPQRTNNYVAAKSTPHFSSPFMFSEVNGQRHTRDSSNADSGIQLSYANHRPQYQQAPSYNTKLSSVSTPTSQSLAVQNSKQQKDSFPQPNSSTTQQTAVQAHVQGWYQQKLREAAERLRQNDSYKVNDNDQSPLYHENRNNPPAENYKSFYSNHLAADSRNISAGAYLNSVKANSSQMTLQQDRSVVRGVAHRQSHRTHEHFYSETMRPDRTGYVSDTQSYFVSRNQGEKSVHIHYDPCDV